MNSISYYRYSDLESVKKVKNYRNYLVKFCKPYITGQKVLEVGAGIGNFSKTILEHKPRELTLLEPNSDLFEKLKILESTAGVTLLHHYSYEIVSEYSAYFDSLIYNNVLEHIEDDVRELKIASQLIHSGGHLVLILPAHQFLYSVIDKRLNHYRRYELKMIKQIVHQSGCFEITSCRHINKLGALGWWYNKIFKNERHSDFCLTWFDLLGVPVTKILDFFPPYNFGLTYVVALIKS